MSENAHELRLNALVSDPTSDEESERGFERSNRVSLLSMAAHKPRVDSSSLSKSSDMRDRPETNVQALKDRADHRRSELYSDVDAFLAKNMQTGVGHYRNLLVLGLGNAADSAEVLAIGYILAALRDSGHLSTFEEGLLTSALFVGMLIGGLVMGFLGDRIGRRSVFIVAPLLYAVCSLLSSLAYNVNVIAALRMLGGVGIGGTIPPCFSLAVELSPPSWRGKAIVWIVCNWVVGSLYASVSAWIMMGYFECSWRLYAWTIAVPATCAGVGAIVFLPESPYYLVSNQHYSAALDTLELCHSTNVFSKGVRDSASDDSDEEGEDREEEDFTDESINDTVSENGEYPYRVQLNTSGKEKVLQTSEVPGQSDKRSPKMELKVNAAAVAETRAITDTSGSRGMVNPGQISHDLANAKLAKNTVCIRPKSRRPSFIKSIIDKLNNVMSVVEHGHAGDETHCVPEEILATPTTSGKPSRRTSAAQDLKRLSLKWKLYEGDEKQKTDDAGRNWHTAWVEIKETLSLVYSSRPVVVEVPMQSKALKNSSLSIPNDADTHRVTAETPSYLITLLLLQFCWFTVSFASDGVAVWIPILYEEAGFSSSKYASVFIFCLSQSPAMIICLFLIDHPIYGREKLLLYGCAASVLSTFLFAFTYSSMATCLILSSSFEVAITVSFNVLDALATENFPTHARSTAFAVQSASGRLGAIVAQLLFSSLIEKSIKLLLLVCTLVLLVAVICSRELLKISRRKTSAIEAARSFAALSQAKQVSS